MPSLQGKYSRSPDWGGKVVQSCVHCHQIGDAQRTLYRERKEPIPPNLVYPFPAPETVGVELTLDQVARVKSVKDGSPAARAGLKTGDDLVSLAGQPLISFADVSWVLHQAPEKGSLAVAARRNGEPVSMTIELPEGWRDHSDIARRVGTWTMRAMALGGLFLEDLSDAERERRGLGKSGLALYAKHVGEYGEHAAAKKAGFLKEDVLVQVAGLANRHTESELIGSLLKQYRPGDTVKVTVLRGNERVELNLPMQ
jgi:S1-C subfamily serine protease